MLSLTSKSRNRTQYIYNVQWNGTNFGYVTKINGTSNNEDNQWGVLLNNIGNDGLGGIVLEGYDNYDDPVRASF